MTSIVLPSPPWLGWPLWSICVTNDHGYVPFFINTSTLVFSGIRVTRSLALCVCFVDRCSSVCSLSFDHYVVCPSIYGFWLPPWYLQTLLVLFCFFLSFILWSLHCVSFELLILMTPLTFSFFSGFVFISKFQ